jgi:hypothetical protein
MNQVMEDTGIKTHWEMMRIINDRDKWREI